MSAFTLALRNVRKSFKDYGVYFLTIMIGVALFYVFNSIESQSAMMELRENEMAALLGVNWMMSGVSLFISAILGFLILYANAFLIRRRNKELGIYMLLGMKKGKISRILIMETMLVGLLSLAAGLMAGVFLSQWFALITAKLLGASISRFAFVFSWAAVIKSVVYFGMAFLVVILFNTRNISRQKLIDLIYAGRKNENARNMKLGGSAALFAVSAAMLAFAYVGALNKGLAILHRDAFSLFVIACGIAGTFLFFASLSGFFLRLVSRMNGLYFSGLNLFVLKQLNSKIRTSYVSMSFVCLMLFLAITAVSSGSSIAAAIKESYGVNELGMATGVSYMASYVGVIFMVACASVLAIAQLSEASDNQERYALLSKLGAGERLINGAIFKQVLIYFAAPLILAAAHSVVSVTLLSGLVYALADINILVMSLVAGLIVLIIYGAYFMMTYANAKKMANAKRYSADF
jgi:putative ABC transport system permease protein